MITIEGNSVEKNGVHIAQFDHQTIYDETGGVIVKLSSGSIINQYGTILAKVERGGVVSSSGHVLSSMGPVRKSFNNANALPDEIVGALWLLLVKGMR